MSRVRSSLFITIGIIMCFLIQAQGADKYTDENRPYEFGFTIDGEQHRHEKKDKNGIIQGEFGFITADGVYHVTVYATDEQGRFKILSMKNIRVKPYPTGPTRQGHSLKTPSTENALTPAKDLAPPHDQMQSTSAPSPFEPAKSCSHCSIPTTSTQAPPPAPLFYSNPQGASAPGTTNQNQRDIILPPNYPGQQNSAPSNVGGQQNNGPQTYPQQNVLSVPESQQSYSGILQNYPNDQNIGQLPTFGPSPINPGPQYNSQENPKIEPFGNNRQENYPSQQNNLGQYGGINTASPAEGGFVNGPGSLQANPQEGNTESQNYSPQNEPGFSAQDKSSTPQYPGQNVQYQPENGPLSTSISNNPDQYGLRTPKQSNLNKESGFPGLEEAVKSQSSDDNLHPPTKPKLIAAQMQIVDKNTDIYNKRPGEQDGLPKGLNKNAVEKLLYTFNYTLGFQGHFEEGYANGSKQGYYFVTGRNGVRTRVDYVADDTGFHPRISQEIFDVSSDQVPKPESEKDERYGLKGYEFKWLYYPVGS